MRIQIVFTSIDLVNGTVQIYCYVPPTPVNTITIQENNTVFGILEMHIMKNPVNL